MTENHVTGLPHLSSDGWGEVSRDRPSAQPSAHNDGVLSGVLSAIHKLLTSDPFFGCW